MTKDNDLYIILGVTFGCVISLLYPYISLLLMYK